MSASVQKTLIILGANQETKPLVAASNALGFKTVVLDPFPQSPAKEIACSSYDVDVMDAEAVDQIIAMEDADGVLVGVADPLVREYQRICARHGFYCYASETNVGVLTSKAAFAVECSKYGIDPVPSFEVDEGSDTEIESLDYPVIVKPTDRGAGTGISVCYGPADFREAVIKARGVSKFEKLQIEKFMQCDDMLAYYTFIDGKVYLSAIFDRHRTLKQRALSPVCLAANYPSVHIDKFLEVVNPKLLNMFQGLQISNGVLAIQFFFDGLNFYAYDPGFRLQGEAPNVYLKHFNGFDHREMLLRFSVTGSMNFQNFETLNDASFGGQFATTIWVLLRLGYIASVEGVETIKSHPNIIEFMQRFGAGDEVTLGMLGTERQVFARIYVVGETREHVMETVNFIHKNLDIRDNFGVDMILDRYKF